MVSRFVFDMIDLISGMSAETYLANNYKVVGDLTSRNKYFDTGCFASAYVV